MRKRFSERNNIVSPRSAFQIKSIDSELKNRLWNQIQKYYFDLLETPSDYIEHQHDIRFFERIYDEFFKNNVPISHDLYDVNTTIKSEFFDFQWYEIYDFIEYISQIYEINKYNQAFRRKVNQVLEDEMSGYRFVDEYISQIVDAVEINEIEEAIGSQFSGAKIHLSNSLESLSDRDNPDYINSIKESISAVESIVNNINGTTNVALNKGIPRLSFDVDKTFKSAMIKLYSWTSSSDGIRHGITGEGVKSSFAEAKYMLVTCSAFINYLIEKQE